MSVREFADLLHDFGPAVANHLWQSTAFAGMAAALAFALRRNQARARYWIWMAASLKFLVPFALLAAAVASLAPPHVVAPANAGVYTAVDQVSEPFVLPTLPIAPAVHVDLPVHWGAVALAVVWAIGFCAVLITWCVRWRRVARVVRAAVPITEGREAAALARIAADAGVRRAIRMRVSESTLEPGVFGVLRSVLLWPAAISARLTDQQLDAVLAHEVCHVRRRDNLTALMHMFVEAVFWFHPMVWWMGSQLMAERERACDEAVIALCPQPQVYAESILKVCEFCVESPLACVSGITGADLKRRIVDIMTVRVVRRLSLGAKVGIAAAVVLAVAVPVVLGTTRVLPALYGEILRPSGPLPSFEAVTIKPARPDARGKGFNLEGRHFRSTNTTAADLVLFAYGVQAGQVEGAPAWLDGEAYDITGVAPETSGDKPDWKLMVQKLLADRFGFSFHTGTKEMVVYELHVGKNGPRRMTAAPDGEQGELFLGKDASGPGDRIHAKSTTMAAFAKLLETTQFDRPVIDRTGISGKFDFEMTFLSDHFKGKPIGMPVEEEPNAPPGIFTAIQDQLGLKLEPAKGPTETLVIDQIHKPELDVDRPSASSAAPAPAQLQGIAVAPERLHFDVVSIRPADPNLPQGSGMQFTDDGFHAFGMPFDALVRAAYALGFVPDVLQGLPDWARGANWDIQARVADADVPEYRNVVHDFTAAGGARRNAILRNLLADEFKLKAHPATKEGTVYALVAGKGKPKLEKADPNGQPSMFLRPRGHLQAKNVLLGAIAPALAQEIGHPVVDKTGLTERYNFTLNWAPDRGAASSEPAASLEPDALPSIFTAIQEQLGLKLEAQKGTVEYLVIDSAAKPTIEGSAALMRDASVASQLPSRYENWLEQDVRWIITPDERAAFMKLVSDRERGLFVQRFWQRRNPTPNSSDNPFKAEHYRRISYANERFAEDQLGCMTDRGRTYVVYGNPDQVLARHVSTADGGQVWSETWHYQSVPGIGHGLDLTFVNQGGHYKLQSPV